MNLIPPWHLGFLHNQMGNSGKGATLGCYGVCRCESQWFLKITIKFSPPTCTGLQSPENIKESGSRNVNGLQLHTFCLTNTLPWTEGFHFCVWLFRLPGSCLALPSARQRPQVQCTATRCTKIPNTHFYFLAEGGIGAILQLALMVNIVDHSRGNDLGLQAFLLGDIIETEPPAPAEMKTSQRKWEQLLRISFVFSLSFNRNFHPCSLFFILQDSIISTRHRTL